MTINTGKTPISGKIDTTLIQSLDQEAAENFRDRTSQITAILFERYAAKKKKIEDKQKTGALRK